MKRTTLDLLSCPCCHASLTLLAESGNGLIDEGSLVCTQCDRNYPIKNGIPSFVESEDLDDLNRHFARSYDGLSRFYDLTIKFTFLAFGGDRKARMEILERLELSGGRVLEVSVGTGMNLPYLFENPAVGEVYGLDISVGQLARCQNLIKKKAWDVDLFQGTAEQLPYLNDTFDTVFHIGGINFFSGKEQAILEMIRVAKPGCRIVIADETERLARFLARMPGFSGSEIRNKPEIFDPLQLVPTTMQEIQMLDIWKAHGEAHGYCLEFRKPG